MSRSDKKARDAERAAGRRQSLSQAAINLIDRKGLTAVTLAGVAREGDCGSGLVSFHFETKDRLLLAAHDALVEDHREAWHAHSDAHEDAAARLGPLIGALAARESPTADYWLIGGGRSIIFDGFWVESQIGHERGEAAWMQTRHISRAYLHAFTPKSFGAETDRRS